MARSSWPGSNDPDSITGMTRRAAMSLTRQGCAMALFGALAATAAAGCSTLDASPACAQGRCDLPLASVCSHDSECTSGACAAGICCERSCDGACEACNQLHAIGRCLPAPTIAEVPGCAAGGLCSSEGLCSAGAEWAFTVSGAGAQQIRALGGDGERLLMAGTYAGELLGAGAPASGQGAFVAALNNHGQLLWRRLFPGGMTPATLASAADGAVLVGATFSGAMTLGREQLVADGLDSIVLRLAADGTLDWARRIGGSGNQQLRHLALGPDGMAAVGDNAGTLQLDGTTLAPSQGADAFVVSLDAAGALRWARQLGSQGTDIARSVVVTPDGGGTLVGGVHNGPLQLGDRTLSHVEADDAFVARFDAEGQTVWAHSYGGTGADGVGALALAPGGELVVAGMFTKGIDFGGQPMVSLGCEDVFVAKLTLAGEHLWSTRFGDDQAQLAEQVALDADGRIYVSGMLLGGADLGWGPAQGGGGGDVHISAFSPAGVPLWVRALGDEQRQRPHGLVVAGQQLVVGGYLEGSLHLGEQLLQSDSGSDGFIAALAL